uniref:Uncharacterized protein n=1 Tax=Arundo donax TaxID=35708 RepID=A0A0A9H804_ARUDO
MSLDQDSRNTLPNYKLKIYVYNYLYPCEVAD